MHSSFYPWRSYAVSVTFRMEETCIFRQGTNNCRLAPSLLFWKKAQYMAVMRRIPDGGIII